VNRLRFNGYSPVGGGMVLAANPNAVHKIPTGLEGLELGPHAQIGFSTEFQFCSQIQLIRLAAPPPPVPRH
jgi:hypothetical protein